jgi:fatty acid desaturase
MNGPLPLHPREVAARFSLESTLRCELLALFWHAVLLGSWGGFVAGWWSAGVFFLVGLCAFVRNFNALHELTHSPGYHRSPLLSLRVLMNIVVSPLQLGLEEASNNHRTHHAHPKDAEQDPTAYLNNGPWWRSLLNSLTQPEQSLVRWALRRGLSKRQGVEVVWNIAVLAALGAVGGLRGLVWWLALTRLGVASAWYIFDWLLHHDAAWGTARPLPVPRGLQPLWMLLFGRENLYGIQYHTLHHQYPFVRDRDLPELSRLALEPRSRQAA